VQVELTRTGVPERLLLGVAAAPADLAILQEAVDGEASLLSAMAATAAARVVHALARNGWAFEAGEAVVVTEASATEPIAAVVLVTEGGQQLHLTLAHIAAIPGPSTSA
jgi:hypothetical protein